MARKKRITLIRIILSTLLLAGPGVVDIANAEPISSSIPTDFERQSVPSTLSPSDSIDDGPAQESVKWNLGWNSFDGNWFYVDSVNPVSLHSGWLYTNGAWYWLDPSTHAMATGVQTIGSCEYIFNSTGKMMANCWSNGDGSWMYHSSSSGAIDLKGIMTDSGIQLIDDDGNARTGWIESQGARYYCSASGVILTGWQQIAGSWYYFNPDGRMATGWLNDGSNWYWLDSASGAMKTGWLSLGGTWYYLDVARGGVMLSNGWYWIGSTDYKFSSSGAMVGAWVDVPCYSQYPELPTGCESVALTNLLNYYGFGLGKTIIADYYLPKGSNGNFVTAFDGNPRRNSGGSWDASPLRLLLLEIIFCVLLEVASRQKTSLSRQFLPLRTG